MKEARFWEIIARTYSEEDRSAETEKMTAEFQALSSEELESFGHLHEQLRQRACTWDLWGAAFIIGGGCSDAEFWTFLGWLISRGRHWYDRAVIRADDLAEYPGDIGEQCWQFGGIANLASDIHLEKFGFYPAVEFVGPTDLMTGEKWEESEAVFQSRWPRLYEKCRKN